MRQANEQDETIALCPECGKPIERWKPAARHVGREVGYCPCHRLGPVIERTIPPEPTIQNEE